MPELKLLILSLILVLLVTPAFAQLSDRTGLVNRLDVTAGGHTFEVETVSNFDVADYEFSKEEKRLTIFASSGIEKNLAEVIIPNGLLSGNFTFYLNGTEIFPDIRQNEKISFVTLNFTGAGDSKIDIIATRVLSESDDTLVLEIDENTGGGCLIATAAYGSEMAPQVQLLREIRDGKVMTTGTGAAFMSSFNQFYYSFSPYVADYQRENPVFKEMVRIGITPLLASLEIMNNAETEQEILGYGIGVILLNVGMYFAAPLVVIGKIRSGK